ncbi:EDSP protein, partial [Polypterus senegalus]
MTYLELFTSGLSHLPALPQMPVGRLAALGQTTTLCKALPASPWTHCSTLRALLLECNNMQEPPLPCHIRGVWVLYEHGEHVGRQLIARAGVKVANYGDLAFNNQLSYLRPLKYGSPTVKAKIQWEKMVKDSEKNVKIDELVSQPI